MHLGMDVTVSQFNYSPQEVQIVRTIQNLCTTMAGIQPASLPIEVQSTATNTVSYTFSLSNGDHLIALWTNGVAVDDDPGIPATLTIPDSSEHTVIGIDVLHGFTQRMITEIVGGDLVIHDILIKDYPIIFRVTPTKYLFLPLVLKGSVH